MFNVAKIQSSLNGLVGFRQPANPTYAIIDAANLISRSSRYVTDHSLLKVEYIKENLDFKDATAIQFNTFLANKQNAAIVRVMDKIFNKSDFIDRQVLYQQANNKIEVETLPAGFVGFKIETSIEKNWAFEITRAILEFQGTGDVTIMLWNSAIKEPLQTKVVTIANETQEVALNWRLDNTNVAYKGNYYLGYNTQSLVVAPFKRNYENANVISTITGMCFEQIEVAGHIGTSLFDFEDIDGSDINVGINLDITVFNDATNMIIQNQFLFAKAIETQMIIDLLSEITGSLRLNLTERQSDSMMTKIIMELEGLNGDGDIKKAGLKKELMGEINHIRKEIKRLQRGYFASGFLLQTLT